MVFLLLNQLLGLSKNVTLKRIHLGGVPNMLDFSFNTIIIIVTVIISMIAFSNQGLFQRLMFWSPGVNQGQIDRFITHGFVHADMGHLFVNMFTLYFFGSVIEQFYTIFAGQYGYLFFYLAAICMAILPSYLNNRRNPNYASVGASGAVSAVLFAYVLLAPWSLIYLFAVIPIPAIVFAIAYVAYGISAQRKGGSRINHSAHLWGALFGVIFTIAVEPGVFTRFLSLLLNPSF